MTPKKCPRCGTALTVTNGKMNCPGCGVNLVRKAKNDTTPVAIKERPAPVTTPVPVAALDFTEQAAAPPPRRTGASFPSQIVLVGAALFLLLGTVLTGYAFSLTFSTT